MLNIIRKKFAFNDTQRGGEVDENLSPHERWLLLSKSEDFIQRQASVSELVECAFEAGFVSTCRHILPGIKELLKDDDAQVRSSMLASISNFAGYLIQSDCDEGYVVSSLIIRPFSSRYKIVTGSLTPLVLNSLYEDSSIMNRIDAGRALVQLCSHISSSDKNEYILVPLISKISTETADDARSLLTESLGNLTLSLGPSLVEQFVIPQLRTLVEDPSSKVRRATVYAIRETVRMCSPKQLVPCFFKLLIDSSSIVRNACCEVFHEIYSLSDDHEGMLNLLFEILNSDPSSMVRRNAAMNLGHLLSVSSDQSPGLLSAYTENNLVDHDVMREHARCFSAVLKNLGPTVWKDERLDNMLQGMVKSIDSNTRRSIAAQVGMIAAILGVDKVYMHFESFFDDPTRDVLHATINAIPSYMQSLHDPAICIIVFEKLVSVVGPQGHWRTREVVSRIFNPLCQSLLSKEFDTAEIVWSFVLPMWLILIRDKCACVRSHAVDSAGSVLNLVSAYDGWSARVAQLLDSLVCVLGQSKLAVERQTFLQIVSVIMNCFGISPEVVDIIFLKTVMHLAHDPAPAVRTTWAREICPHLRFPGGRWTQHRDLVIVAHQLLLDMDKEVVRNIAVVSYGPLEGIGSDRTKTWTRTDDQFVHLKELCESHDRVSYGDSLTDWLSRIPDHDTSIDICITDSVVGS